MDHRTAGGTLPGKTGPRRSWNGTTPTKSSNITRCCTGIPQRSGPTSTGTIFHIIHCTTRDLSASAAHPAPAPSGPGEDFRAGRWWWEDNSKKECGLHVQQAKLKNHEHDQHILSLDYLDQLESEAIHILREVAGQFERPALLFSGGKDSITLVHLALKAFRPGRISLSPRPHRHRPQFPEALTSGMNWPAGIGERLIVRERRRHDPPAAADRARR
jgi:hypothetical protein